MRGEIKFLASQLKGQYNKEALKKYTKEDLLAVIYNLIYTLSDEDNRYTACTLAELAAVHILSDVGLFDIEAGVVYKSLIEEGKIVRGKLKEVHG